MGLITIPFQTGISPGHDGGKLIELYGKSLYYGVDTVTVRITRIFIYYAC